MKILLILFKKWLCRNLVVMNTYIRRMSETYVKALDNVFEGGVVATAVLERKPFLKNQFYCNQRISISSFVMREWVLLPLLNSNGYTWLKLTLSPCIILSMLSIILSMILNEESSVSRGSISGPPFIAWKLNQYIILVSILLSFSRLLF